ncbi:uncharacterized protein [Haliotis cracherodii]|uniref:uncharacterized protein n=1 Tax=Haliotis cracherodii TaxID=6455 RepID=UPI0039ECB589
MEIKVNFSVSMVIAVVLAEAMSFLWYNNNSPWGRRIGDRYLITALVSDVGLVVLLKFLMENYWSVGRWEDAAILSCFLTLVYMTLQAPHIVHNSNSFSHCFAHSVHKFCVMFVMLLALVYFRHY